MCELAHEDPNNAMGSDLSDSLFTYCSMSGSAASQVGGLGISPASAGGDAQGQGQAGGTPEPPRRGGGVINTGNLQTLGRRASCVVPEQVQALMRNGVRGRNTSMRDL